MTDQERIDRCIEHITECHDRFDDVVRFIGQNLRENADGDFVIPREVYVNFHTLLNAGLPARPKQAMRADP